MCCNLMAAHERDGLGRVEPNTKKATQSDASSGPNSTSMRSTTTRPIEQPTWSATMRRLRLVRPAHDRQNGGGGTSRSRRRTWGRALLHSGVHVVGSPRRASKRTKLASYLKPLITHAHASGPKLAACGVTCTIGRARFFFGAGPKTRSKPHFRVSERSRAPPTTNNRFVF